MTGCKCWIPDLVGNDGLKGVSQMAKLHETWREKLGSTAQKQGLPRVVEVNEKMSQRWGTGTVVIPSPVEVDALMKSVPEGKLITINQIRAFMAGKYNATFG
jgi:hypothetical protein